MKIFNLPDLGEGLPDAEIVRWHVNVGDAVTLDQILVSVETAKAVVEVPSPIEGIIRTLFGKPGDLVHTGAPLVEFESEHDIHNADLQSHHSENTNADRRNNAATAAGELEIGNTIIQDQAPVLKQTVAGKAAGASIRVTPAIRALAQQLQIDLATVSGTGPNGTITKQDLEQAAVTAQGLNAQAVDGFEPLKGVRRAMANSMAKSHAEVVPITVMDDAKLLNWPESEDVTIRIIQAIVQGFQKEPDLNTWFDSKTISRRVMNEIHLGIAMDTEDGLFVPVLHHAEKYSKAELRIELDKLKKKVLDRSISPQDLRGATFTLSNVGVFAGRYANPVVIPPTVAILATGKIREEVVADKGEIRICKVLPLALTFDHRAVTGGEATRFLGAVMQSLQA